MKRPAAVIGILCAVLLAACGSTNTTASEKIVEGGVFRQGLVHLASTDPAKAQSVSERVIASELYTTLTNWNQVTNIAVPGFARSWQTSEDKLHWVFALGDARAANGEAITADDVKKSIEHVSDKATGSLLAEALQPITGLSVVDQRTIRFDLSTPFSELPSLLSNPALGVVHYAGNDKIATGAFSVLRQRDDSWVLRKVANGAAHLDEIDVTFYPDARSSYEQFKQGNLDWTPISPADEKVAGDAYGTALFRSSLRTLSLSFNLKNPKFADTRFREAIVRAVERTAVATKLDVNAVVLNGVVPSGVSGEQMGGCGQLCFHDRQRAQELVRDVFPNGAPPLTIDIAQGSPFTDASIQQIIDDLSQIGVKATVRQTTPDKFGSVTVQPDRELFQTSWSGAFPTAGAFIDPLYRSNSPSNVSGLKDDKVDGLLKNAFSMNSTDARINYYRDAEKAVTNQLPVLPIAQFPADSVKSERMRGIAIGPMGTFDIANVWAVAPPN